MRKINLFFIGFKILSFGLLLRIFIFRLFVR